MSGWTLFLLPLLAIPLAYFIGRMAHDLRGRGLFGLLILAPLIAYHLVLIFLPPAEGGFWPWWGMGLIVLAVPLFLWLICALMGYELSRSARRQSLYP